MLDLILRNATLVTLQGTLLADVGILDGKIAEIGSLNTQACAERDCVGLHILPGLIDMHVHLRDPGWPEKEDFHTGTRAALVGGVTTIFDMPNTNPPTTTIEALEEKRKIAASKSLVNFGLYMALTDNNLDDVIAATNLVGVKVWLGQSTGNIVLSNKKILEKYLDTGRLAIIHAEDEACIEHNKVQIKGEDPALHGKIRSPQAALLATKQIIELARKYPQARLHITHLSTAAEVEALREAKLPNLTADCTPHHLFLDESAYKKLKNFAKVNPPLRTLGDRKALLGALKEGLIQAVATDHAPHTIKEKQQTYAAAPSGLPGLETMLPLLLTAVNAGKLTLEEVVAMCCENPAQILGINNKGKIEVGADADLVVVDMQKRRAVGAAGRYVTRCNWSPYEGMELTGWPVMTVVNGTIAYGNGIFQESFRGKEL